MLTFRSECPERTVLRKYFHYYPRGNPQNVALYFVDKTNDDIFSINLSAFSLKMQPFHKQTALFKVCKHLDFVQQALRRVRDRPGN